jgi:ATP-dependent RNA helicase DBP3
MGTEKTNKHLSAEEKAAKKARKAEKALIKAAINESDETASSKSEKKDKKEKRKRASDEDENELDFFAAPKEPTKSSKKSKESKDEEKQDDSARTAAAAAPTDGLSFRKLHNISLFGILGATPEPILDWEKTPFPHHLVKPLVGAGFQTPSPIQATCWPIMLAGRDTVRCKTFPCLFALWFDKMLPASLSPSASFVYHVFPFPMLHLFIFKLTFENEMN